MKIQWKKMGRWIICVCVVQNKYNNSKEESVIPVVIPEQYMVAVS